MKVQHLRLTWAGIQIFSDLKRTAVYRRWQSVYGQWPNLFPLVEAREFQTYRVPPEELQNRLPLAVRLMERFSHVPAYWDDVRSKCFDVLGEYSLRPTAWNIRQAGQPELRAWLLPFAAEPLCATEIRPALEVLGVKPLTALDALSLVLSNPGCPFPICAVGSVFLIEGERYILSCEWEENQLPIIVLRRERYLPREAMIPVYAL